MATLTDFPPEIFEKVIGLLSQDTLVELGKTNTFYRSFIAPFEVPLLRLLKFPNVLHIASLPLECPIHFFAAHNHSLRSVENKEAKEGWPSCFRTFAYPPTEKYSIFGQAKINHLEINKELPLYLDNDNLEHLTNLLAGCWVEKITLVLDWNSLDNVVKIPAFLASIHAKHVEFVLQKTRIHDMLKPFLEEKFALDLAKAGIREVTFSANWARGSKAFSIPVHHPRHDPDGPSFAFDIVLNLVKAGIENVTVNANTLENDERFMTCAEFRAFLKSLPKSSTSLHLQLELTRCYEDLDENYGGYKIRKEVLKTAGTLPYDRKIIHVTRQQLSSSSQKRRHV